MEIDSQTRKLIKVVKRPPVNIEFNNLCYSRGEKKILKSINGKFSSGHLTGIFGSSGAGKTSLLNVLAGQLQSSVSGSICINGIPRVIKSFHKISSYIMQEDLTQPFLTVKESITIAANLKLSKEFSKEEKESMILGILSVMGLETAIDTKVEHLSGGQRKRLVVALELVNNPSVIFLDEPTTGLDDVAMRNCMKLLKFLTLQGRTIVCTMHQPSDSMFKLFDTVYFLSDGFCIYNGSVPELVPFLSNAGYPCPINYNPADYIIEIAHAEKANSMLLKDMVNNGIKSFTLQECSPDCSNGNMSEDLEEYCDQNEYSVSFWMQFSVLIGRNFLQISRNRTALALHFVYNIICGLAMGLLFYQIGMKGSQIVVNLKCLYGVVIYLLFSHMMSAVLLYPFEVKLLEREYFNRWYSLNAYFAAFTVGLLPIIVITTIIFVTISYPLSGQPLEWYRFFWFCLICVLMAVTSQGMGYTIGTLFNPTRGACVASASAIPLVLLGMYGVGYGDTIDPFMKSLMGFSFPYHSYVGLITSILKDRGNIECDKIFCILTDSDFWLLKMGMSEKNYSEEALFLVGFMVFHRLLSYLLLKLRVSPQYLFLRNTKLFSLS